MTSTLSRLSEPSAVRFMCSGRLFRLGEPFLPRGSKFGLRSNPNFGGDHHLVTKGIEGFAHKLFVQEGAVDLGAM